VRRHGGGACQAVAAAAAAWPMAMQEACTRSPELASRSLLTLRPATMRLRLPFGISARSGMVGMTPRFNGSGFTPCLVWRSTGGRFLRETNAADGDEDEELFHDPRAPCGCSATGVNRWLTRAAPVPRCPPPLPSRGVTRLRVPRHAKESTVPRVPVGGHRGGTVRAARPARQDACSTRRATSGQWIAARSCDWRGVGNASPDRRGNHSRHARRRE
jgi:hypothetical protein